MRRRTALTLIAALLAASALAGCGGGDEPAVRSIGIATGNSTGVYAVLGRGLATLVTQQVPGYRAGTDVTGGSEDNIDRVVSGQDAVAFVSMSWASDAITGRGAYGSPQPIRAVARLYLNYLQVVVRSDIHRLEDLKGRRVSTGSRGSTGELAAARLLRFAGLDIEKDTRRQKRSLDDSVELMKQGRLDAIFWSGGLPTAGVQDVLRTMGPAATLLDLGEYYDRMSTGYPDVYEPARIAPTGYGLARPARTLAEPNLLVVRDDMDPDLAGRLTGTLLGNLPQLASVHPEGRNITRGRADRTDPVPLHSGALQWYRGHPAAAG